MLTKNQFTVLNALREEPGASQRSLASSTGLALGTVNAAVKSLQEGGLIVEESDEDVRNASLEAAKEAAASLRERHKTVQRDNGGLKGLLRRMR